MSLTHSLTESVILLPNQVEVRTRFAKALTWICQSYYIYALPSAKPNQVEVWPSLLFSFCFCCWIEVTLWDEYTKFATCVWYGHQFPVRQFTAASQSRFCQTFARFCDDETEVCTMIVDWVKVLNAWACCAFGKVWNLWHFLGWFNIWQKVVTERHVWFF